MSEGERIKEDERMKESWSVSDVVERAVRQSGQGKTALSM